MCIVPEPVVKSPHIITFSPNVFWAHKLINMLNKFSVRVFFNLFWRKKLFINYNLTVLIFYCTLIAVNWFEFPFESSQLDQKKSSKNGFLKFCQFIKGMVAMNRYFCMDNFLVQNLLWNSTVEHAQQDPAYKYISIVQKNILRKY